MASPKTFLAMAATPLALSMLLTAACSTEPAPQPQATIAPSEPLFDASVPRELPIEFVVENDGRPLEWSQKDFLTDVLQAESHALQLEASLAAATPDAAVGRPKRIAQDRATLTPHLAAVTAPFEPGPESSATLAPIDLFLLDFARERLQTDGYSLPALEKWWRANLQFLESRSFADRDLAIEARAPALESIAHAMPLRQLIADLALGPLKDDARAQSIGALKIEYPDAPLPAVSQDVAAGSAATPRVDQTPDSNSASLPKLDGAASPLREVKDVGAMLSGKVAADPGDAPAYVPKPAAAAKSAKPAKPGAKYGAAAGGKKPTPGKKPPTKKPPAKKPMAPKKGKY